MKTQSGTDALHPERGLQVDPVSGGIAPGAVSPFPTKGRRVGVPVRSKPTPILSSAFSGSKIVRPICHGAIL